MITNPIREDEYIYISVVEDGYSYREHRVLEHPIYHAIRENKIEEFQKILPRTENINWPGILYPAPEWLEITPLMLACTRPKADMVEALILAGADIEIQTTDSTTALCFAASNIHSMEPLECLLRHKAQVFLPGDNKYKVLNSVWTGHFEYYPVVYQKIADTFTTIEEFDILDDYFEREITKYHPDYFLETHVAPVKKEIAIMRENFILSNSVNTVSNNFVENDKISHMTKHKI